MTLRQQSSRWASGLAVVLVAGSLQAEKVAPPPALRWTAATPDEMLDLALRRATKGGDGALAGLALAHSLSDRAAAGRARAGLEVIGRGDDDIATQARWLAAELDPKPLAPVPGLVRNWAVLGPFQDSGGGLARHEGPEEPGQAWGDPNASYAWGAYEVRWREVPREIVSARGIPLELLIHPRKESCSYLATKVTLPERTAMILSVASTGSIRLVWDGAFAASSDEDHQGLVFDRLSAKVDAIAGDHLLGVKVCSGAPNDEGRVRVRATSAAGRPIDLATSAPAGMKIAPDAKVSVNAIPTALARAVETGKSPSEERALYTGVVRSLGNADDLRSPRSPGLLDKVANGKRTSPDALAMAGWISPFGASRSGWLNLAAERALAAGDSATASFAERRLAVARLSARWADWAMASLAREPFASEQDSEARLIRSMVRGGLGLESLRRVALTEMLETANNDGARASVALWQELATLARSVDPLAYASAKNRLTELVPEGRGAGWVQSMTPHSRGAVKTAAEEALASGAITSADELLELAEILTSAGLHDDARLAYERGARLCPNRAAAFSGLASAKFELGKADEARRALERARQLEPAEVKYRAELVYRSEAAKLATRSGSSEKNASASSADGDRGADGIYLVEPSVFLTRKDQSPAKKGEVFDRQLHWMRAVTFHADRRVSQLIQYAREIVIEPRTQDELYESIPAEGDDTEILRARVHRASGGVAFAEEQKSEGGRPAIRWPDLKTGDVVEVAIRSWTSGPVGRRGDPPFYFMDYAGSLVTHPLLYNDVVVDSPADHPLAIDVLHGKADRVSDETKNGRRVVRMIWDKPTNIPDEPLAPKSSEVLPTIVGSTFASWKEFREWYQAAVEGFTEPDDQVRRLAADLTKGKTSKEDKVKAIFEYVADDIRYVNYVSGEWWLPNRPQQLLARRQGDCDDKAILLITLLKAVGIEATEVLVQTRYTAQPSLLMSPKVAIPLFDHGIAFLPGANGAPGQWLDATSPQSRLGPLPSMDARAVALYVSQGTPGMVKTPPASPDEHGVDGTWKIQLTPTGAGDLDAVERHVGDHAFVLRSSLGEKDARAQWVEQNLLSGWFPTVEVGKDVEFTTDLPEGAARVHYKAHSAGLARREAGELVVPLAPSSTMTSQLAPLVKRTLPVVLPPSTAPSHQTRTIRIVPPPGFRTAVLAKGGEENGGEFGFAKVEIRADPQSPKSVLVKRTVVFDTSTIPIDKYDAWRAWLQRVDALLHRSVRFTPSQPKTAGGPS
ncbi:MAG TPA: transglutaminase domain-containing protein [Polyangiaceae bacterium]|nr:transglutaminase domain-containing protein [Polyangiaceae bacterium]